MKHTSIILALLAGLSLSSTAQAALHDRGGGLIYDDVLNVTWLQDANYASTSGFDADGFMNWNEANNWATNLVFHDSERNIDYSNWRLPLTLENDASCGAQSAGQSSGFNCSGSEMGHLFYVDLGGVAGGSIANIHNTNYDLFINLQYFRPVYWSATESSLNSNDAWRFLFMDGSQDQDINKIYSYSAWAVHAGDVAAVPEPEIYAMMLAALGLIGVMAQRRKTAEA